MAFGDVRQQLSMGLNRWISKFWSGYISVKYVLCHSVWQTSDTCPLCHKGPEKSSHVITCQQVDAKNTFQKKIKKELSNTMKKTKTTPAIQSVILEALKLHC